MQRRKQGKRPSRPQGRNFIFYNEEVQRRLKPKRGRGSEIRTGTVKELQLKDEVAVKEK